MELKKCRNSIIINLITLVLSVGCFVYFHTQHTVTEKGWLVIAAVDFIVLVKNIADYCKLKKQADKQAFSDEQ